MAAYSFVSVSEPGDYICPVSQGIMLDPYKTNCCGLHLSSREAVKISREGKSCPLCRKVFTANEDLQFKEEVSELEVYCPHYEGSCEWTGPLKDVQMHTESCDMRPWRCDFCDFKSKYHIGTTEHAQKCQKRPIECLCGVAVPSCDYEAHLKTCPSQLIACEFADVGCEVEFPRESSSQHREEFTSHHQLLVSQRNLKLTREIHTKLELSEVNAKLREEGAKDKAEVNKLQEEVEAKKQELSTLKRELEMKEEHLSEMRDHVKKMEDRQEEHVGNMERMEKKHQEMMERREDQLQQVGVKLESMMQDHQSHVQRLQEQYGNGMKDLVEEVVARVIETRSLSSYDAISPVSLAEEGETPQYCRGKLEGSPIGNLKKAWGVAVGGDKLYVVDHSGSHGLHVISIREEASSVEKMIESASFNDMNIPKNKCWYPKGVALDKQLNIYLTDTAHRVLKFSPQGKILAMTGEPSSPGNSSRKFSCFIGVSIDPNGRVFVCDCDNHRVVVFDSDLQFLEEFGGKGNGDKKFTHPWDVAFDSKGNVYIADCGNRCIKVFTPELEFLKVIGKGEERYSKGDLRAPSSLCIDSNDYIYVVDKGFNNVLVYDTDANYKTSFGKFNKPFGIAVDSERRVYVSDNSISGFTLWTTGRVQVYT